MPKSQEDLKLSDLAGAKPHYNDIHFDISAIMHKYPKAVYELDRILFGKDQTHVNTPTQTMNGWYDVNLLPYYKYRLETTPIFHTDDVISEFIGNLEKYLIDLTDLAIERYLKEKVGQDFDDNSDVTLIKHPVNAAEIYSKVIVSDLKAQEASKAIKKKLGDLSKKVKNDIQPTDWTLAPEDDIHNAVSHPSYYELPSGRESKDVIRDFLGTEGYKHWVIGTSLKYIARYANKELPVQDIEKSIQYLNFLIDVLKEDLPDVED